MSLTLKSVHQSHPIELDEYVASYKVFIETPEDSLAKYYESANNMEIELEVPKSNYKDERIQGLISWSRLPASDPDYYRDIAVRATAMGDFERSIVFSHGRILYETSSETESDFVNVKLLVRQKEDMYAGVATGNKWDDTYAKAWSQLEQSKVNPVIPLAFTDTSQNSSAEIDEEFNFIKIDADFPETRKIIDIMDIDDEYIIDKNMDVPFVNMSYILTNEVYNIKQLNEQGYRSQKIFRAPKSYREDFVSQRAIIKVKNGSGKEESFEGYLAYGEVYVIKYEDMLNFMDLKIMRPAFESTITVKSTDGKKVDIPMAEYPESSGKYLDNLKLSVVVAKLKPLVQIKADYSKKTEPVLEIIAEKFGMMKLSSNGVAMIANFELSDGAAKSWGIGAFDDKGNITGIYPHYVFKKVDGRLISDGGITFTYGYYVNESLYKSGGEAKRLKDQYAPNAPFIPTYVPNNGVSYKVPGSILMPINEAISTYGDKLKPYEKAVNDFLILNQISLNQYQFDALVSFTYQYGPEWWNMKGKKLPQFIIEGKGTYADEEVRTIFDMHDSKPRRKVEAEVFINGYR